MDPNPYQSPTSRSEPLHPKPRRELRPIIGVPGAILFLLFGGMFAFAMVDAIRDGKRVPWLACAIPMVFISIGVLLIGKMVWPRRAGGPEPEKTPES